MDCSARRRQVLALVAAMASAAGVGCAGPKPPLPTPRPPPAAPAPPPTMLRATLIAHASVNPDIRGRPSPVIVRVYGLKTRTVMDTAHFFALFEKDKETLGADLVDREEFQLQPGDTRLIEKQLKADFAHLGVFAAFRDVERAQWRDAMTIIPRQLNRLEIQLEQNSVRIIRQS